jgi:hypothetical protein
MHPFVGRDFAGLSQLDHVHRHLCEIHPGRCRPVRLSPLPYPRSPTELFSFAAVRVGPQSAVLLRHSDNTLNLK